MLIVKCRIKPLFRKNPLVAGMSPSPLFAYSFTNKGIRENVCEFSATKGAFKNKSVN